MNAGDSVAIRTATDAGVPYHIEIYRTGYYRGSQGRPSAIPGLNGSRTHPGGREPFSPGITETSRPWEPP